jgi:hypothetical protein
MTTFTIQVELSEDGIRIPDPFGETAIEAVCRNFEHMFNRGLIAMKFTFPQPETTITSTPEVIIGRTTEPVPEVECSIRQDREPRVVVNPI